MTSSGNSPLYSSIVVPRTVAEQAAGLAAVNSIPAGRSVLLSIGMSNAKGLWDQFKNDAESDPLRDPDVQVVNGAQPGGSTQKWAIKGSDAWIELDESLGNAGVTKSNVTVIWFMIHNAVGSQTLEGYSTSLESDARKALDLFASEFPNLKVVWLEPMIYAGYSTTSGNSEPYAHESGQVAQRLLVGQSWPFFVGYGPYLWADGILPRDDGLTWLCSDFKEDGNHPDTGAKIKVSDRLIQFFHEDSVASIGYLDTGTLLPVPDVVGLDQAVAESAIVSAGLSVGTVSMAGSSTVLAGKVISQSPAGGTSASSGTPVALVVSLGPVSGVPMMTSPPDGSTLSGSSVTFTWSAEGTTVTDWWLEIGTTPGGRDLFRKRFAATVTSQLVTGLPTNGSTVYVILRWRIGTVRSVASYVYTASGAGP